MRTYRKPGHVKSILLFGLVVCTFSCSSQSVDKGTDASVMKSAVSRPVTPLAEYVTSVYEDDKGHLWFGTIDKGIARYDGEELRYFGQADGLPTDRVISVIQDSSGLYWMASGEGLVRYDEKEFKTYRIDDGPSSNSLSQLFIDSQGTFWIGTWSGVYIYDGEGFEPFNVPYAEVSTALNADTKHWVTEITEGPEGVLWFARDGSGICRYDGENFSHLTKKDGLLSNNITVMEVAENGQYWIGSRIGERDQLTGEKKKGTGGLNVYDGNVVGDFSGIQSLIDVEIYEIYEDPSGHVWICTTTKGVYRYSDTGFEHFDIPISIMGMIEDGQKMLWLAGAGGLYRIDSKGNIIQVGIEGPWK